MPLPNLDALPLILLAWAVGVGMGWGLCAWMVRRRDTSARPPLASVWSRSGDTARQPSAEKAPRQPQRKLPESAPATVSATAPTAAPAPAAAPAPTTAAAAVASQAVADLLVVDDSAVARTKLRRLFEAAGYQVHLANDGIEALALLDKGDYKLLITDLEMPNMDGVELINTCLARPQTARMPILAISGHESLRAKFNECRDICGIHRKPWVDDILLSHVATVVGARQPRANAGSLARETGHRA